MIRISNTQKLLHTSMVSDTVTIFTIFFFFFIFFFLFSHPSTAAQNNCTQTCKTDKFNDGKAFDSCSDLPVLGAHLHWSYCPQDKTVQIAYRVIQQNPAGWISWGLNPEGPKMDGTQALVAYGNSNGRSVTAYTTQVISYDPDMHPKDLKFGVSDLSAEYAGGKMSIYAKIGPLNGTCSFHHVWQVGPEVSGKTPLIHITCGQNVQSTGKIEFCSK